MVRPTNAQKGRFGLKIATSRKRTMQTAQPHLTVTPMAMPHSSQAAALNYQESEGHAKMTYSRFGFLMRGPSSIQPSRNVSVEMLRARRLLCMEHDTTRPHGC